jgi:hypothetical protein
MDADAEGTFSLGDSLQTAYCLQLVLEKAELPLHDRSIPPDQVLRVRDCDAYPWVHGNFSA